MARKTIAKVEDAAKAREAELQAKLDAAEKARATEEAENDAKLKKAEEDRKKAEEDAAKKQTPNPNLVWVIGAAVAILIVLGIVFWWTNRSGQPDSKTETTRSSFEKLQDRVNVLQAQMQTQPTTGKDEAVPSEPTVQNPPSPEAEQSAIERMTLDRAAEAPGGSSTYLPQAKIRFATGEAATEYEKGEADLKRLRAVKEIETARFYGRKSFLTAEREAKKAEQEAQKAEREAESQKSAAAEKAQTELKAARAEAERAKNEANSLRAEAEGLRNSLSVANTSATAYEVTAEKKISTLEQQNHAISEEIGNLPRTIESREKTILIPATRANPCRW